MRCASTLPYAVFAVFLMLNIGLWAQTRLLRADWGNVPPVLSKNGAMVTALGDAQTGYRTTGIMLQNLGNSGGEYRNLATYDYVRLGQWFRLADALDPVSDFMPALAAFYFGAAEQGVDLAPLIDYLAMVGQYPQKQKWRWLAQAAYLARYKQDDLDKALRLAQALATLPRDDLPIWATQMPAFIMMAKGDKEAAYGVMMGALRSGAEDLSPSEVMLLRDTICRRILTPAQAARDSLCTASP